MSIKYKLPPTPTRQAHELIKDPLAFFLTLTRQYGDVICYRQAPERAYLVNHPDHIRHILVDNNRNYSKDTYINRMFKSTIGDGLLTSEGESWRRQRSLMQPAFHHHRIEKMDSLITETTAGMLKRWDEIAREYQQISIAKEMADLTLCITAQVLFGVDVGEEVRKIGHAIIMGADLLAKPQNPRFQNALLIGEKVARHIIEERRRLNKDTSDLLSMLLLARDEKGSYMTERQLLDQVKTLLLAGSETVASALTWVWYLLSQNPHVRVELHAELADVLGGRTPTFHDLSHLSYTKMIFEESLRLYPSAWILGRKALSDDVIGMYDIPAETTVAISPYTLHRHPGYWDNPDVFNPSRFAPENSKARHRFAYLPFGGGPRQCIGNHLAIVEAQLIISMVAQRFDLYLATNQPITPKALFVLLPDHNLQMTPQSISS